MQDSIQHLIFPFYKEFLNLPPRVVGRKSLIRKTVRPKFWGEAQQARRVGGGILSACSPLPFHQGRQNKQFSFHLEEKSDALKIRNAEKIVLFSPPYSAGGGAYPVLLNPSV